MFSHYYVSAVLSHPYTLYLQNLIRALAEDVLVH